MNNNDETIIVKSHCVGVHLLWASGRKNMLPNEMPDWKQVAEKQRGKTHMLLRIYGWLKIKWTINQVENEHSVDIYFTLFYLNIL